MSKPSAGARPWYEFKAAKDSDSVEIRIYDSIGWWGVTASDFAAELDKVDASEIVLRINSSGGDVFDGFAIFNLLRDHPATVRTIVDGFAASIASIIALAGDTVEIHEAAVVMIHDPWGVGIGNAEELRQLADVLDKTIASPMAKIYAAKMDLETQEVRDLMASETWYTGEEAVEAGFADTLLTTSEPPEANADARSARDLSGFRNPPASLTGDDPPAAGAAEEIASDDADLVEIMRRRLRLQELDE
jgi:ATP-dependent protease ClpP protease subunit